MLSTMNLEDAGNGKGTGRQPQSQGAADSLPYLTLLEGKACMHYAIHGIDPIPHSQEDCQRNSGLWW